MTKKRKMSTTITIRMSPTMDRALVKAAKRNERSKAFMIRSILAKELDIPSDKSRYDLHETSEELSEFAKEFEKTKKDTL